MSKPIFSPLENIKKYLLHYPQITELELSVYKYHPQSVTDEREIFHVSPLNLAECLIHMSGNLSNGEEIAFHSKVLVNAGMRQEVMHIPMIDFRAASGKEIIRETERVLAEFNIPTALLFHTGRSFHLYGAGLLKEAEWGKFMGRILLINLPDRPEIVDSRWVGHCLMAGTSRLRWTKNSDQYISEPKFVKSINAPTKHVEHKILEHA